MLPGFFWDTASLTVGFFYTVILFGGLNELERLQKGQYNLESKMYRVDSRLQDLEESNKEEREPCESTTDG